MMTRGKHIKWFPKCVYVRYVMDGNEQRSDFAACDGSKLSTHKCTIV